MYFNLRYDFSNEVLSIIVLTSEEENDIIEKDLLNQKIYRGRGSYDYFCKKEEVRDFLISEGLEKFIF